ncbi:hypothetical protein C5708_04345 [Caulobacter sp. CCUG 60055]|uniref:hypothetical protein n=1 Tax=Caulobacter sp. CCUG 60055 TaxID=2100090 RepID=UPI001FA808EE|nr:hypothetical protein [Caulobacter sp. CCUG 60055]MBQ1542675.1 hypothetical protein [Caulobacteraceae bacterium]MCI3179478.1 hypothetical protein [Caulobacter sp. CCUG 60055]
MSDFLKSGGLRVLAVLTLAAAGGAAAAQPQPSSGRTYGPVQRPLPGAQPSICAAGFAADPARFSNNQTGYVCSRAAQPLCAPGLQAFDFRVNGRTLTYHCAAAPS